MVIDQTRVHCQSRLQEQSSGILQECRSNPWRSLGETIVAHESLETQSMVQREILSLSWTHPNNTMNTSEIISKAYLNKENMFATVLEECSALRMHMDLPHDRCTLLDNNFTLSWCLLFGLTTRLAFLTRFALSLNSSTFFSLNGSFVGSSGKV